ncbi:MAG TPA: glycosyltransferase family 4 protein [Chloroflexota bacterium]|nr:glycosyltransferase family 4 protein [Chloroflexota bacterium]
MAPVYERVPPRLYGGTERVVHALTEELVRRGHEVTLFASADSHTSARLVPVVDRPIWSHNRYHDPLPFHILALGYVARHIDEFDIVHSHLDYLAFPLTRSLRRPVVTTLHGRLDLPELEPLFREFPDPPVVSISNSQRAPQPHVNWVATVYNGLDLSPFRFQPAPGKYLVFLGRISPEKGLDLAVAVALRAGVPLKIAARMPLAPVLSRDAERDWAYYREVVEPLLSHPLVEYVGEVSDEEKAQLLGGALALLFPIDWPEPFGLVMVEALACGTPVIARPVGSVPEVIEHGVTGFLASSVEELAAAVARVPELDRYACRRAAETRFSAATMADGYERVYRRLLELS